MKSIYAATVRIAFEADDDEMAKQAVLTMLSGNLMESKALVDWQYLMDGNFDYQYPFFVGQFSEDHVEGAGQFIENLPPYLLEGNAYRIKRCTSSKRQLIQLGETRFIKHFLQNAYFLAHGSLRGFGKWKTEDPATFQEKRNIALKLYENIAANAGKELCPCSLIPCKIGVVCFDQQYFIQLTFPENKHQYFNSIGSLVAIALAQKEGIFIEEKDTIPAGIYLAK